MFGWPFTNKSRPTNPIRTLLIGGFLMYFAIFVVLPQLFVMGYFVRVLRYSLDNEESSPTFDEWGKLLFEGTKAYTIWIAYLLLPIALLLSAQQEFVTKELVLLVLGLFFSGIVGALLSIVTGGTAAGITDQLEGTLPSLFLNAVSSLGVLELLSITLPFVLTLYIAPAGLINFIEKGSFRSGFDIRGFSQVLLNRWYLVGWLLYISLWIISSFFLSGGFFYVINILQRFFIQRGISTIGAILLESLLTLSNFISFYLMVIGYYYIGRSWIYASQSGNTPLESFLSALDRMPISTILVGSFLLSAGTILAEIFLIGYLVRLVRYEEGDNLPEFDNWLELFTNGVKSISIYLCYITIPLIILSRQIEPFTSYLSANGLLFQDDAEDLVFSIVVFALFTRLLSINIGVNIPSSILSILNDGYMRIGRQPDQMITDPLTFSSLIILSFLVIYLFPAALANFAVKNRIRAGFEFRYLFSIVTKRDYTLLWGKLLVLWTIGSFLLSGRGLWTREPVRTKIKFLPSFSEESLVKPITVGEFLPAASNNWIEGIPIVSLGTSYGLVSAGTLLLFSIINFCILIYTYRQISHFWRDLDESNS